MKQNNIKLLETYFKELRHLKTLKSLSMQERFMLNNKVKIVTDSIIYYNGGLFKIVEKYSSRRIQLTYKLLNLTVREFDILEYKNSENKFIRDYYKNELKPKLASIGLAY